MTLWSVVAVGDDCAVSGITPENLLQIMLEMFAEFRRSDGNRGVGEFRFNERRKFFAQIRDFLVGVLLFSVVAAAEEHFFAWRIEVIFPDQRSDDVWIKMNREVGEHGSGLLK